MTISDGWVNADEWRSTFSKRFDQNSWGADLHYVPVRTLRHTGCGGIGRAPEKTNLPVLPAAFGSLEKGFLNEDYVVE